MDRLQEKQVNDSKQAIAYIRRQLDELRGYGWKPTAADQTLTDFEKFSTLLDENIQAIKSLKPRPDKSHEKELKTLLDTQAYLIESLESTARTARENLREESLNFFDNREKVLDGINSEIEAADDAIQAGYLVLCAAIQRRWGAMLKKRETFLTLARISTDYNTTPAIGEWEISTGKPFKSKTPVFPKFVSVVFSRLGETLAGAEHAAPADIANRAFSQES